MSNQQLFRIVGILVLLGAAALYLWIGANN